MKYMHRLILSLLFTSFLFTACQEKPIPPIIEAKTSFEKRMEEKFYPEEGHMMAKNYPETKFAYKAYQKALADVKKQMDASSSRNGSWVNEGPGNIGGRINTIAMNPTDKSEMMVGFGYGGVFKTTNAGEEWYPVFDNEDITTISDVKYDPNDGEVVYVGTGDLNISGFAKNGRGIFKSVDGGESWNRAGLEDAGVIAEVGISKANSDIVYAASMGIPFVRTADRGLYKSINGGDDWEQVLYLNDSTGIIDIEVHPADPNIVYAASWTRIRNNEESILEGDQVGIFKTTDGGANWTRLGNGLPEGKLIRPGLAMYEGNPDVVYSIFVHDNMDTLCNSGYHMEGIYKTSDAGESWTEVPTAEETGLPCNVLGGFGWYFGKIRVSPFDEDIIYVLGVDMYDTKDGGQTWNRSTPPWWSYDVHADKHDLMFDGTDMYLTTDGGAYKGNVFTEEWEDIENIISTQFYRVAVSPHDVGSYFGGAQDNGTTGGNESFVNDWPRIFGGDGFQMVFHPTNPLIYYVETQRGNIRVTFDGGENYENGSAGLTGSRNWDMQYIMSKVDPSLLYTGTNRMFRSFVIDGQPDWQSISGDLTDTLDTYGIEHNITTLDESPVNENILYCGLSDGFVWRSLNFGTTWEQINDGLPRRYISDIKASLYDENTVYLTIQGYKDNDNTPYIYKSTNNGDDWVSINGNLPQIAINDILILPGDPEENTIFVGTDGGVFFTQNGGETWDRLGNNMPIFPTFDLAVTPDNLLVAGSFARGIFTFDLSQLDQTSVEEVELNNSLKIYPSVTDSYLTVEDENASKQMKVRIFSLDGTMKMETMQNNRSQVNVSRLSAGSYILTSGTSSKIFIKI
ncbi:MAG: T9SS type A sorting domain-containing protein [Saprospiraceae bacterium]|nr:T9SS type A sorting domain-containing protein [Saprospiraceae bacterium]